MLAWLCLIVHRMPSEPSVGSHEHQISPTHVALLCALTALCCEGLKQAVCQTFAATVLESYHLSETRCQPVAPAAAAAAAALAADEGLQAAPQAGAEALPEARPMQVKPWGASAAAG